MSDILLLLDIKCDILGFLYLIIEACRNMVARSLRYEAERRVYFLFRLYQMVPMPNLSLQRLTTYEFVYTSSSDTMLKKYFFYIIIETLRTNEYDVATRQTALARL